MLKKIDRYALELLMIVSLVGIIFTMAMKPDTQISYIQHTVQAGETVWQIAESFSDQQIKPLNEFSWMISKENGLEGKHIHPGDQLLIPLVKEVRR